jgi:hypothetical protein
MILHREAEEPWLLLFTKAATLCSLVLVMALLWLRQASAGPVTVRFVEGVTHVSLCCIRLTGSPLQPAISSKFSGADKSRVAWYSASRTGRYMTKQWCSLKSESLPCRVTTWYTADPRSPKDEDEESVMFIELLTDTMIGGQAPKI